MVIRIVCLGVVFKEKVIFLMYLLIILVVDFICIEIVRMLDLLDSLVFLSRLNMFYIILFINGIVY